jgi:hypothetical protein
VLDDRCRLCDPPHGLGSADDAERPDDPQTHRLGAASRVQVVENYPVGTMAECTGDDLRLPGAQVPREDFGGRGLRVGDAVGRVAGHFREDGRPIRLGANLSCDRLGDDDGIRQRGEQV